MNDTFSDILRSLRIKNGLVQQDMAKMLGISAVAYGGWERGSSEPSLANLVKLCRFFHVTADCLIGLDRDKASQGISRSDIAALKSEADQATATLARLVGQIREMEKSV